MTAASNTHSVGVLGASGSSGAELIRLLSKHPRFSVSFATSRQYAGHSLRRVDPAAVDIELCHPDDADTSCVEAVFTCLPHGSSAPAVKRSRSGGARVIDLSGDFRLRDPETHRTVYGSPRDEQLAAEAVYGLSEFAEARVREAGLVANPGCYPTCTALAVVPAVKRGLLRGPLIINALSGVSGAGRTPSAKTHFCAAVDDVRPYNVGSSHRHVPEIEQSLRAWSPAGAPELPVIFNPHLVPLERGMLVTITASLPSLTPAELHEVYTDAYRGHDFVDVLPMGEHARIRAVARTNRAVIAIAPGHPRTRHAVITCAIDNLLKGAAGQALQNANTMFGFPIQEGLA
ncbi:MAG: N-acetyl-gamma-glutamyl-phosphate reductase [Nannocystaceae bacterium]|nr:N-acetyl-gamma-glutamyl-phosphate reductase [bacterium]